MTTLKSESGISLQTKALAALAVIASIVLAMIAWLSGMHIAVELAVRFTFIVPDIGVVQRNGILRTVRTSYMMCGGVVWLIVAIASIGYHSERLGKRRSWRILAWTIGIELAIIAIDVLMQLT